MNSLLCVEEASDVYSVVVIVVSILVVAAIVAISVVTHRKSKKAQDDMYKQRVRQINDEKQSSPFLDGNGRTAHQRDYLNRKRRELSERNVAASDGSHEHIGGKVEKYDKIVGSLGEVDDEGCDELDGVRLIEHDEAYCDDPEHFMPEDNADLVKAMVLGEVVNTPRFKQLYHRPRK